VIAFSANGSTAAFIEERRRLKKRKDKSEDESSDDESWIRGGDKRRDIDDYQFDVCNPLPLNATNASANASANATSSSFLQPDDDGDEEYDDDDDEEYDDDDDEEEEEEEEELLVDFSAEDAVSAKFEGNLVLSFSLLMLITGCHLTAEYTISRPYKRWLHSQVLHHSSNHPHLAMPKLFGQHHATKTQAFEFGAANRGDDVHSDIVNTHHPIVLMAHKSASLAKPLYYKLGRIVTSVLRANPFPMPEIMLVSVIYQGCCQSSSALMFHPEASFQAVVASVIFIVLPVGFFAFVCWHCVYQVWWRGRAKYYTPPPEPEHPLAKPVIDGSNDKQLHVLKLDEDGAPLWLPAPEKTKMDPDISDDSLSTYVPGTRLKSVKALPLGSISIALELCSSDTTPDIYKVDQPKVFEIQNETYVRVLDAPVRWSRGTNARSPASKTVQNAELYMKNGLDEALVLASDGVPGEWTIVLVKMAASGETKRVPAELVQIMSSQPPWVESARRNHIQRALESQEGLVGPGGALVELGWEKKQEKRAPATLPSKAAKRDSEEEEAYAAKRRMQRDLESQEGSLGAGGVMLELGWEDKEDKQAIADFRAEYLEKHLTPVNSQVASIQNERSVSKGLPVEQNHASMQLPVKAVELMGALGSMDQDEEDSHPMSHTQTHGGSLANGGFKELFVDLGTKTLDLTGMPEWKVQPSSNWRPNRRPRRVLSQAAQAKHAKKAALKEAAPEEAGECDQSNEENTFECENDCGYTGLFEEVTSHEKLCPQRGGKLVVIVEDKTAEEQEGEEEEENEEEKAGEKQEQEEQDQEQEQQEEQQEETDSDPENGWEDAVGGDGYVARYGVLFWAYRSPCTAAIFAPLDVLRMLIIGWSSVVLIDSSESFTQAGVILFFHALQFGLGVYMWPTESLLSVLAMATDLVPLLVVVLPTGDCGPMGMSTQLLILVIALLNTAAQIVASLLPVVCAALTCILKLTGGGTSSTSRRTTKSAGSGSSSSSSIDRSTKATSTSNGTRLLDAEPMKVAADDAGLAPAQVYVL
jgi:hypothetical protein